jgi:hypothetical protein
MQWAAAHWQLEVCQLLLAKGADVEAYNWDEDFTPVTPLGIACFMGYNRQLAFTNIETKHAIDTLGLLSENGLDTHASVEIDHNLFFLGEGISQTKLPHSVRRAVAQQFSWLMRKYIQATTYDGLLSYTGPRPEACKAIMASNVCFTYNDGFWNEERSDCKVHTLIDTQTFHSFWLFLLAGATEYGESYMKVSPEFCQSFAGNFHFQKPWVVDGDTFQQSPMQLALRSFDALGTFHSILMASGTDIVRFTELECTMPWCTHTQETLMDFFSLQPQSYTHFRSLFSTPSMCHDCDRKFQHEGLMNWEETVELVESGRSLAILLQFPSEEAKDALFESISYCEDCRLDTYISSESDESEDDQTEDDAEHMGFIESEIEGDENPLSGMRVSGMGNERLEGGTDACSSDEDLE